jgi:hypothetical protein
MARVGWKPARKQIDELRSPTLPSTSQGPWAEPGWWRARGVASEQSEGAYKRVGLLQLPTLGPGVLLCHPVWGKAAFASTPAALAHRRMAGLGDAA